jgi:hypothetical protein
MFLRRHLALPVFAAAGTLLVVGALATAPDAPVIEAPTPPRPELAQVPNSDLLVATTPTDDNVILPPLIDRLIVILRDYVYRTK